MDNGFGDFLSQVWGLVALTFISGAIWLILSVIIFQRAAERRRRKREGLEPLPSFFTQFARRLRGDTAAPAVVPPPTPEPNVLLEDPLLEMDLPSTAALTSDIPLPAVTDLLRELEEEETPPTKPVKTSTPPPVTVKPASEPVYTMPLVVPEPAMSMNYVPGSNELPADAVELMRVWRDVSDGTLIVGIKDRLFATAQELRDPELARRFAALLRDLNQLAGNIKGEAARPVTAPAPTALKPVLKAEPAPDQPAMGIADQIEAYLQTKLALSPAFAQESLHIRPAPSGGVRIEVNDQFYEAVSDIPDETVRAFLQQAIAEWESQH